VREFSAGDGMIETMTLEQTDLRGATVIAHSLNNAAGTAEWTPERVLDEIDFTVFNWLNSEIMGFMGWKKPAPVDDGKKNEDAPASSPSTSTK
jgi:hypothetical protein